MSEFLIGVEIGSLHTTILRGWKGILPDSSVSDLFFDGNFRGFFEDGPSKVYFYGKGGLCKKDQTPRTELEQAQIEIEQLKHKLYLAEMENALLKKLDEVERRDASQK